MGGIVCQSGTQFYLFEGRDYHDYNSNHDGWVNFSEFLRKIEDAYDIEKALKKFNKLLVRLIPFVWVGFSFSTIVFRYSFLFLSPTFVCLFKKHLINLSSLKNDGSLPTLLIENHHPAIVTKEVWLAANKKLKEKAIEYQKSNKYDDKREGKICINKSIYSGLYVCRKCGKNYNFKINNRGKGSERRIFTCASNRSRKECQNDDLPLDVIDIATLKMVNKVITNKNSFYKLLEDSFNEKNSIDKKQKEIR